MTWKAVATERGLWEVEGETPNQKKMHTWQFEVGLWTVTMMVASRACGHAASAHATSPSVPDRSAGNRPYLMATQSEAERLSR